MGQMGCDIAQAVERWLHTLTVESSSLSVAKGQLVRSALSLVLSTDLRSPS